MTIELTECPNCSIHHHIKKTLKTVTYSLPNAEIIRHAQYCVRKKCGFRRIMFDESVEIHEDKPLIPKGQLVFPFMLTIYVLVIGFFLTLVSGCSPWVQFKRESKDQWKCSGGLGQSIECEQAADGSIKGKSGNTFDLLKNFEIGDIDLSKRN